MQVAKAWALIFSVMIFGACGTKGPVDLSSSSSLPPCASVSSEVRLPPDFPKNFPLPPRTVVTSTQLSATGTTTISAAIPMQFKEAVAFFQSNLPAAGYQLLEGDAEMDEAESTFAGQGFRGKWKINGILNCPGAVRLTLGLAKA